MSQTDQALNVVAGETGAEFDGPIGFSNEGFCMGVELALAFASLNSELP